MHEIVHGIFNLFYRKQEASDRAYITEIHLFFFLDIFGFHQQQQRLYVLHCTYVTYIV